jgi:hypothetical protein
MGVPESSRMRRLPSAPKASNTGVLWNAIGSQPVDEALKKMKDDGWVEESTTTLNNYTTMIMKRNGICATLYIMGGTVGMIRFQAPIGTNTPAKPENEALTKTLAAVAVLKYLSTHGMATRHVLQEKLAVFSRAMLTQGILLAHAQQGFRSPTGRQGFSEIEDFMLVPIPERTEIALKALEKRVQQMRGI